MTRWSKKIIKWRMGKDLYLSIPFTWLLPEAQSLINEHRKDGKVFAGGPAVDLMPNYLGNVKIGMKPPVTPLSVHNPFATFTTKGCSNNCLFCAVPKIEGAFQELKDFPILPIICDNDFLESSKLHFLKVIDSLKRFSYVDFNQGLNARKFTNFIADNLAKLKHVKIRFAFDHLSMESRVHDAIKLCRNKGLRDIGVYVLFGFNDTPDEAHYRLEKVREWGIRPNPMRYQPLNSLQKNDYILDGWTDWELKKTQRYYSRLKYFEHIPYIDFEAGVQKPLLW